MLQQSLVNVSRAKNVRVVQRLKILLGECQHLKSELNSIKNMAFKSKRKIDIDLKYVRDTMRSSLANKSKLSKNCVDQNDKENSMRAANAENNFQGIEVKLGQNKGEKVRKCEEKKELKLGEKILLELQEIKLLEQRKNLISKKKNQRLSNYYSQNKTLLDGRRSQAQQNQT